MSKIIVELDLLSNALTEVLPGISMHNRLPDTYHLRIELEPRERPLNHFTFPHAEDPKKAEPGA
jgi:hypothetical protein